MADINGFYIRTEDISNDNLLNIFVETRRDRQVVDSLKSSTPTVLVGSRGVGKSFLLRVAAIEQKRNLDVDRVFPIYLSFTKSSLVQCANPNQFHFWMLAKLCNTVLRAFTRDGLLIRVPLEARILSGGQLPDDLPKPTELEIIENEFESFWQEPNGTIDTGAVPDIDKFKDAIEDICQKLSLSRISLFIDEAAHVFLPQQQRSFFTLFRDLRSPYITCNAAIYPGVTSYGESFQPAHDATFITVDREVMSDGYIANMREIVEKQADSETLKNIERNGQLFATLAYAASGNPRLLLKTLSKAWKISSLEVNDIFRTFYRSEIWAEHSILAEKYPGHKRLVDWGRNFIESVVLPDIQRKNVQYLDIDKSTSSFFWIQRDAPIGVKHALQILCYTGVVSEHSVGMKATRGEIGTRYSVNLGCLFALEQNPALTAFNIARALSVKRMTEFGATHPAFLELRDTKDSLEDITVNREALASQLSKPIDVLDITPWQKSKLKELNLTSVRDVLKVNERDLMKAEYIGNVRARQMRNAAESAVFEYLSG
jgi:hypothetical protein